MVEGRYVRAFLDEKWHIPLYPGSSSSFVCLSIEAAEKMQCAHTDALRLLSELGDVAAASNARPSKAAFMRRALAVLACSSCRGNVGVYSVSTLLVE